MAQAKLNLGLRVLARERSGYHSIETVFARLDLGDRLTVKASVRTRSLECDGPAMPPEGLGPPEENLAWRAAVAYADATGWPRGFAITIEKVVPTGAGLGGGSADAGATLRALNALAPAPVPEGELLRLGALLGADVPFLTSTAPLALAWGRGERLLRLAPLPTRAVALVVADFAVETAAAYEWLAASRRVQVPEARLVGPEQFASWEALAPLTENDFESVVGERYPTLPGAVEALRRAGASIARMTGAGSTVYGIFASPPDPASIVPPSPGRVVITSTAARVGAVEVSG